VSLSTGSLELPMFLWISYEVIEHVTPPAATVRLVIPDHEVCKVLKAVFALLDGVPGALGSTSIS
jgi:hypothetical protein